MKFIAILKDSFRETLDSKVFFVVAGICLLAIAIMATLSLQPNPQEEGLQKITERFTDGSQEVDIPFLGKIKATKAFVKYQIQDLKEPENSPHPWEAEYQFVIEARDLEPLGGRIAMVRYNLLMEAEKERLAGTRGKSRFRKFEEEVGQEVHRIQERGKKGTSITMDSMEAQNLLEQMVAFILQRLKQEALALQPGDMEEFIREQLSNHGNWRVAEVKWLDLPPDQKNLKIKTKVLIKEGDNVHLKSEDANGEVNKFLVKVTPREGTYLAWPHKATLFFGAIPLGSSQLPGDLVAKVAHYVVGWFGAPIIMLLGCIITSFFIPSMLRKGTIDLLLAKPVSRPGLLLYKYVGGLTFMVVNTIVLVLGLWVALGLRSGIWEYAILLMIPILTLECALFYALSTLLAVLTRSPIVCILGCFLLWAVLFGLGWGHWLVAMTSESRGDESPGWFSSTIKVAHKVLPHYLDLDWLVDRAVMERMQPEANRSQIELKYRMYSWSESLGVTSLYLVSLLGLSCWRFSAKDY